MPKIIEFESEPTLAEMQEAVGGYIEVVPYFTEYQGRLCNVLVNEDGKNIGLPINEEATEAWHKRFPTDDILVGDVAIVYGGLS